MFGYITVNRKELSPAELEAYRAGYCGLCHALRENYGNRARLLLSFDLCFVALLLSALYDAEEDRILRHRCPLHPCRSLPRRQNRFMEYGADMNILLRYYQCLDDWEDEGRRSARRQGERLAAWLPRLEAKYPRQCREVAAAVGELSRLEKSREGTLDALSAQSGHILESVCRWREDEWAPLLGRIGFYLGKCVYLMDAYEDLQRDQDKGCFNPLPKELTGAELEAFCRERLTDDLAQAARAFERLPILDTEKDPAAALLRNVLYSGIWGRFQLKSKKTKEETQAGTTLS